MSFWPLPTTLAERLQAARARGPVVELGAGSGEFQRQLREIGVEALAFDRDPTHPIDIRGDIERLPFRSASLGAVILANTLRHLEDWPTVAQGIWRCVSGGGWVTVLEDEPRATDPASQNYREALALLRGAGARSSAVVSAEEVLQAVRPVWGAPGHQERIANQRRVLDPRAPVRWLVAHGVGPQDRLDRLVESVDRYGMSYGDYWILCFQKGPT